MGTSVRNISFTKRRPSNKQRPEKLQQKYYCTISNVLHEVFEYIYIYIYIYLFIKWGFWSLSQIVFFIQNLMLKASNLTISWTMAVFLWKCEINFYKTKLETTCLHKIGDRGGNCRGGNFLGDDYPGTIILLGWANVEGQLSRGQLFAGQLSGG